MTDCQASHKQSRKVQQGGYNYCLAHNITFAKTAAYRLPITAISSLAQLIRICRVAYRKLEVSSSSCWFNTLL